MKSITGFFTFYWIIYYPTCIAFYGMNGLSSSIDEAMTIIFIAYTFSTRRYNSINSEAWKEYFTFLLILLFYVAYSIILQIIISLFIRTFVPVINIYGLYTELQRAVARLE